MTESKILVTTTDGPGGAGNANPDPDRPHLSERGSAVSIMLPSESDRNNRDHRVAHMGGAA